GAARGSLYAYLSCAAEHRRGERNREVVFEVGAFFRHWTTGAASAATIAAPLEATGESASSSADAVFEINLVRVAAPAARSASARPGARSGTSAHRLVGAAVAVEQFPLFGIVEHVEGVLDLLKLFFRLRIVWMKVGVVLARELAVRLLDFLCRGAAGDAKRCVIVFSHESKGEVFERVGGAGSDGESPIL